MNQLLVHPELNEQAVEVFFREGCIVIPNVLTAEDVDTFRNLVDKHADNPHLEAQHSVVVGNAFVLRRCRELEPAFDAVAERPEILGIVETILGKGARFNAMNVIRGKPGQAISMWHVDDVVEFPLPPEIPRFDANMRMPIFWMTVQIPLSDIDSIANGPTQFVSGSHYSGRYPDTQENPTFEGREAQPILCRAGDAYLTNHQCWHRGAPNLSDRTRYVVQLQYAQSWLHARFTGQML